MQLIRHYLPAFVFVFFIAVSFLLYVNTINGEFVIDDTFYLGRPELARPEYLKNIWFESLLPYHKDAGLYRPFTVFTFAINKIIFGSARQSFHITSIILNGTVAFLLWLVVNKIFKNRALAFITALFYSFLPIHTEAVAYIKARDEILSALFTLLSWNFLLDYLSSIKKRNLFLFLSSFFLFLGLLSKEFVILAPVLFLSTIYFRNTSEKSNNDYPSIYYISTFYIVAIGAYFIMRGIAGVPFGKDDIFFVSNPLKYSPWITGFWTSFKIAYIYISKTFVPINLSATYHFNSLTLVESPFGSFETVIGILMLALLSFFILNIKTRNEPLGIGALIFLILYLPSSQFLFKGGDILGERWMYLPSLGMALIGGYCLWKLYIFNRGLAMVAGLIILGLYTSIIIPRNKVWTSRISLYESMTKTAPNSVKGHVNLGFEYAVNNRLDEAKTHLMKARQIHSTYPGVFDLGAVIAYEEKDFKEVQKLIEASFAVNPVNALVAPDYNFMYLARAYFIQGYYDRSLDALKMIFAMNDDNPLLQDKILYAITLTKLGKYEESISAVNKYLKGDMVYPEVKIVMAVNYWRLGNQSEARKFFDFTTNKTDEQKVDMINKF